MRLKGAVGGLELGLFGLNRGLSVAALAERCQVGGVGQRRVVGLGSHNDKFVQVWRHAACDGKIGRGVGVLFENLPGDLAEIGQALTGSRVGGFRLRGRLLLRGPGVGAGCKGGLRVVAQLDAVRQRGGRRSSISVRP